MYDVIVIGAGPAGISAGLCASSHKLKTLVISKTFAADFPEEDRALLNFQKIRKMFLETSKIQKKYLEFQDRQAVVALEKNIVSLSVETLSGQVLYCRAVIMCCGGAGGEFDRITAKDSRNKTKIDSHMQTNVPGVFAAGAITSSQVGVTPEIAMYEGALAAISAAFFLTTSQLGGLDNLA